MLARIATAAPVVISALEDGSGPAGFGAGEGEDGWRMSVSCSHWRIADGAVDDRFLYLRDETPVSDSKLKARMARVKELAVMKLEVRLDPETVGDPSAERVDGSLLTLIDTEHQDADLVAIANRRRQPIVVQDAFFGRQTLERRVDHYSGARQLGGATYTLSLECKQCDDPRSVLNEANKQRVRCAESRLRQVVNAIADDLLDLHNANWQSQGRLTRRAFLSRIRLTDIELGDGLTTIYFDDGELFRGHVIQSTIDEDENELWEAAIEG